MKTLDDVRAKYPHLGVACYAYEPGKPVTLEVIASDGKTFSWTAKTEAAAIAAAFEDDEPTTSVIPTPPTPTTTVNVFD